MKKIFLAVITLILSSFFTETKAQSANKKSSAQKETATKTKKDGSPDMRYKENKQAARTKHLKKDGTPDKRYKENKK